MTEQHPVETALAFVEAINRQDPVGLARLMTDDYIFIDLAGDVEQAGLEKMVAGWSAYFALCPAYLIHVSEVYVAGDEVVLIGRTTGSHLKQPRRVEIQDTLIWVAGTRAGQVSAWRLYYDTPDNRASLGLAAGNRWTRDGSL
ncbi:MAG: nuclear transport factor 2 family protein [Anaerolineae bacterium]|jgi:ketosteroid isomerase-like protein